MSDTEIQKLKKECAALREKLANQTAEFEVAQADLVRLNKVKDNFLSIASHELRTPMSVIRGYTDFLLSENFGAINDPQRNFLAKIMGNVEQLTSLINNMLDVSKLEAGKMQFVFSHLALRDTIEGVIEDHRILFSEKAQSLSFECEPNLDPQIKTDPEKLAIVFSNLISNAYKFTPEHGKITVRLSAQDEHWLISIADTGIGIPDDQKEHLFEKFQQLDSTLQKSYSGTGLGLSIVKNILGYLGGEVWVEDNKEANSGTVFNFTLPK